MLCIIFLLFMMISNCLSNSTSKTIATRSVTLKYKLEQQQEIVNLHNKYRAGVSPPASDMMFMQWDDVTAEEAQYWANTCKQGHGFPDDPSSKNSGQNVYYGQDLSGIEATNLWYEEFDYYNYNDNNCQDEKQCGHYTQVVWASSKFIGCGYAKCPSGNTHVVCNYKPGGNVYINNKAMKPYKEGKACSECQSVDGGLCSNKLCVTNDICKRNQTMLCECKLKCFNCGKMKNDSCACNCSDGWDGLECQNICRNENNQCGRMYIQLPCTNTHKMWCREKCQLCKKADPKKPENLCCGGKMCPNGILNDQICECEYPEIQTSRNLAPPSGIPGICLLLWLIVSIQTGL